MCIAGWLGETYKKGGPQKGLGVAANPHVEVLSWDPRIFLYHSFMTPGMHPKWLSRALGTASRLPCCKYLEMEEHLHAFLMYHLALLILLHAFVSDDRLHHSKAGGPVHY